MAIKSIIRFGAGGVVVDIECRLSNSLPGITVVGLGNRAIDESKERVRSALASSHIKIPRKRIIINLAPADIPKESTSLDLAIALSILSAGQQVPKGLIDNKTVIIGELGLTGSVRPVRGIIGKILMGKQCGFTDFYIPYGNLEQAMLIPEIKIWPVDNLANLYSALCGETKLSMLESGNGNPIESTKSDAPAKLCDVIGQERAKRAIEIAAAGGHNILLSGPPGTGKSMLAKTIPYLLPKPSRHELLEITQLHSLVDNAYDRLITNRPFRTPHHSSSHVSIVGGGANLRPGEISLAHRGVLFLDELPEFNRQTIEALRQPLEDRSITISRSKESATYPADFILVATANPCPCGNYGTKRLCNCPAYRISQYNQKLSGPILDRIDIYVDVQEVDYDKLLIKNRPDKSDDYEVKRRIFEARDLQLKRFGVSAKLNCNMTNADIKSKALISNSAEELLNQAAKQLGLSARSYMRIIKVARTIADLHANPTIEAQHMGEAIQYRSKPVPAMG